MSIYASSGEIWYAQEILKAFPQSVREAVAANDLTETQIERAARFTQGITRKRDTIAIIHAVRNHMQNWDTDRYISAQVIIQEAAYRYARENGYSRITHRNNDMILRWVERNIARLQDGPVEKLHFGPKGNKKNRADAEAAFKATLSNVRAKVNEKLADNKDRNEPRPTPPEPTPEPEPTPTPTPRPVPTPPKNEAELLKGFLRDMHFYHLDQAVLKPDDTADTISIRTFENAASMLKSGIPMQAIKASYLMGHSDSVKRAVWNFCGNYTRQHPPETNEWDFEPQEFVVVKADIPGMKTYNATPERYHSAMPYMLTVDFAIRQGFLIGPTGTGKTTMVRHAAHCKRTDFGMTEEEFPFGFISLTRGTAPSAFNGRPMISNTAILIEFLEAQANKDEARMKEISKRAQKQGDVVISVWQRVYGGGGFMLLDEADAGDENLILTVNAAMANNAFSNTATGEIIHRHPDTSIWLAGNTAGTGASRAHNARNKMDAATLDRVRLGRIKLEMDIALAERAFDQIMLAD